MPISHVNIYVRNGQLDKMTDWYLKALAPLGFKKHYDLRPQHPTIGIGAQWPEFWLAECPVSEAVGPPKERAHIAFYTKNRQHVRDFHALALKAGGTDNGAPGLRLEYTATYYAAYVHDPEGRNIEVHSMHPTWMAESSQWNIIMAALGIVAIVGLSYFINYGKYLQRLM